jgi:hypothetical protein
VLIKQYLLEKAGIGSPFQYSNSVSNPAYDEKLIVSMLTIDPINTYIFRVQECSIENIPLFAKVLLSMFHTLRLQRHTVFHVWPICIDQIWEINLATSSSSACNQAGMQYNL